MNVWNLRKLNRQAEYDRPWYQPAKTLLSLVLSPNSTIIEVGCGCGEFAEIVLRESSNTVHYVGLDGSSANLALCKTLLSKHSFAMANFENRLPVGSETADILVSLEVIEHIATAESYLLELNRIIRPGGYLILSTPNAGFIGSRLNYLLRGEVLQEGIHLRFFNQEKLLTIAGSAGFNLIAQNSVVPWLGYNTIVRLSGVGVRRYGRVPQVFESLLSTNFVWLLRKMAT